MVDSRELAKERFKLTIQGSLIGFLEQRQSAHTSEIEEHLREALPGLVKMNGSRYMMRDPHCMQKNIRKSAIFRIEKEMWTLKKHKLEDYQSTKTNKIYNKIKAARDKTPSRYPEFDKPNTSKYVQYVNMLEDFSQKILEDPDFEEVFKNPFKILERTETYQDVASRFYSELVFGIIQGFEIAERYFNLLQETRQEDEYHQSYIASYIHNINERIQKVEDKVSDLTDSVI